jgi:hypothetical protein
VFRDPLTRAPNHPLKVETRVRTPLGLQASQPSEARRVTVGRARQAIGEGLARCSRPPVTLGPPLSRLRAARVTRCPLRAVLGAF